jgi:DNA-binding transcriptional MerR regulator
MNNLNFSAASDEPLYNIGMVSRMTNIPIATLRVWERRYGFPNTTRTSGGQRLCSEREVLRLRWVKSQVDNGMQTAQAIRALQYHEQETLNLSPLIRKPIELNSVTNASLSLFSERLTTLLLSNELAQADQLLGEVMSLYPLEDLVLEVISPTLHSIGEAWVEGRVSVASEHLGSNFLRQRLLMWMTTGPRPYSGVAPIILACGPGEWHEGSLLMMGVLLRRKRWPVAYLGQNVPFEDLGDFIEKIQSPAIILVAMTEDSMQVLRDWPKYLRRASETDTPIVGYGGRVFNEHPEFRQEMQGLFLGETIRSGIEILDSKLRAKMPHLLANEIS